MRTRWWWLQRATIPFGSRNFAGLSGSPRSYPGVPVAGSNRGGASRLAAICGRTILPWLVTRAARNAGGISHRLIDAATCAAAGVNVTGLARFVRAEKDHRQLVRGWHRHQETLLVDRFQRASDCGA